MQSTIQKDYLLWFSYLNIASSKPFVKSVQFFSSSPKHSSWNSCSLSVLVFQIKSFTSDTVFESLSDSFGFREICYMASRTVISPFLLSVWARLPTQLIPVQCLLSCPSEPVFKPNYYNYSACCPVRLSQSSNPTDTTTVFVVLSVWAGLQTQLLQLQRLLSCPPEAVFKPNC